MEDIKDHFSEIILKKQELISAQFKEFLISIRKKAETQLKFQKN